MPEARAGALRVGVIGAGAITIAYHLPSLASIPAARVVAVADPAPAARERARRMTDAAMHADADELLSRGDLDAVVIAASSHLHADLATAAARSGLHAYLEKPVAIDAAGADRVRRAVDEAGTIAVVGFNRRMHPLYRQARQLIARGRIGRLVCVQSIFSEPTALATMPDWKRHRDSGGGVLLDLASHHIDQIRWLADDEIARVSARCTSDLSEQDGAWLHLDLAGGATAQGAFSFRGAYADHVELYGERGTLRVDRHRSSLVMTLPRRVGYGRRIGRPLPTRELVSWRARRPIRRAEPSYAAAMAAFVAQARGGPAEAASLDDGLRSLAVVLAAEESAGLGRPVACGSS